jgi:hypothetical protein
MGKIILEFDSIEEAEEAKTAMQAQDWMWVMYELDQYLRKTTKYGAGIVNPLENASDVEVEVAHKIREEIRSLLNYNNLTL